MSDDDLTDYRGNRIKDTATLKTWHASPSREPVIEPDLPIVDSHHHLYGGPTDTHFYREQELAQDLDTGHRVIGTVYVEAYESGWRTDGPEAFRSVGEVEKIVRLSRSPMQTPYGRCDWAAAIVSNVDLMCGDQMPPVLEAHVVAGNGRLRGVRHHATYVDGAVGRLTGNPTKPHLLADSNFRRGFAWLDRFGLSFDALIFHTQLDELADLADAFPHTHIVLNHVGAIIGVKEFRSKHESVFKEWRRAIQTLAKRPNVSVKIGGMGMALFGFGFEHGERPATSIALLRAWQPYIETCIDAFGPKRSLFESNFPVDKQSCGYLELWNAFKLATRAYSHDERRDLFYRTACRTYGLQDLQKLGDRTQVSRQPQAR